MRDIKVLIIDNKKEVIKVLEDYLDKDNFKSITASNELEALNFFSQNKIGFIIINADIQDLDAIKLCKLFREKTEVPVMITSEKNNAMDRLEAFEAGADDYIQRPFCVKEVITRVKVILKRTEKCAEKEVLSFNNENLIIKSKNHEVFVDGTAAILTATEYKILLNLAKNPKRVFSREQLLSLALGEENESYDRVIDTHVKNLRSKIEKDSKKPKYVVTVYGVGYRFEGIKD
ncbi:MAG: response regulator transcription factor [Sarcina sp.]